MNPSELSTLLASTSPPVLLHVLPEDVFAACRIPGSVNACVYETVFLERIADIVADRETALVVYGAGEGSRDSLVAAEKLRAAGYGGVGILDDGLAGWRTAGHALEGSDVLPSAPILNGIYPVDTAASVIRWTGRNPFNQHFGTVRLAGGEIVIREGGLISGRFTIDMESIGCDDLADASWNAMLIGHLKSSDFFESDRFPTAEFVANDVETIPGSTDGRCSHLLRGEFTLRSVTRSLDFPVLIASADGSRLTAQGELQIDRTEFGCIYGSGRFFRFLGKHVVNDHIHLDVMIHAGSQV